MAMFQKLKAFFLKRLKLNKMNQPKKPRPIDETIRKTTQTLASRFVLASKTEIKAWKALIVIMFAAGFFAALVWSAYNQWYIGSGATEQAPTLTNLVPNPSVENGSGSIPTGWSSKCASGNNCVFTWDKTMARFGSKSLKIKGGTGNTAGFWMAKIDKQKIDPNKVYRFDFWYKANSGNSEEYNPNARMNAYVQWVDSKGNLRGVLGRLMFNAPIKTISWTKLTAHEFQISQTILSQAASIAVTLRLDTTGNDTSEVWFDQIEVLDVGPKPADIRHGSLLKQGANFALWTESASQRVYTKDSVPDATTKKDKIQIQIAKNDSEPFQLAVKPASNWSNVSWEWTDFKGPATLTKNIMKYYRVNYVPIPNGLGGDTPDPLPVETSSALSGNQNNPFWFLVEAPEVAQAGTYNSTLTLKQGGVIKTTIPLELKVWNFTLPKEPTFKIMSHFTAYQEETGGGSKLDAAKRFYQSMLTHRANYMGTMYSPLVYISKDGLHAIDNTSDLEQNLDLIKGLWGDDCKNVGIGGVLIRNDQWQWRTRGYVSGSSAASAAEEVLAEENPAKGLELAEEESQLEYAEDESQSPAALQSAASACGFPKCIDIFTDAQHTNFNPQFASLFTEHINNIMTVLKNKGCYGHPTIKFADEQSVTDRAMVNANKNIAKLLNTIDPNIVVHSSGFPHRDWMPYFGHWDFHGYGWMPFFSDELATAKKKGSNWIYNNGIPDPGPILNTRLFEWSLWKESFVGAYNWWSIDYWSKYAVSPIPTSKPVRSVPKPKGLLPSITTSVSLSITTDRDASCKYSSSPGIDYDSMPSAMSTSDKRIHTASISGLTAGKDYKYYVRCKGSDGTLNRDDAVIHFAINNSAGDQPAPGRMTIPANPWDQTTGLRVSLLYPKKWMVGSGKYVDFAPQQSEGPVTSLRWEMMRQGSEDYDYFRLLKKLIAQNPTSPYLSTAQAALKRVNEVINGRPFTSGVFSGGPLEYGYAHILDAAKVDEIRTQIGRAIELFSPSVNATPTPPVRSSGSPTGTLPAGTTATTLSLTTNENATCKYSTTAGISYDSMTNTFTSTGQTSHSTSITGLVGGQTYKYYARCKDAAGNKNTDDYLITFSVASSGSSLSPGPSPVPTPFCGNSSCEDDQR